MSNAQVAHNWAHQLRNSEQGSSCSYIEDRFYSWSTIIAEICINKLGQKAYILSECTHSSYTSRHQNFVRRAIPSNERIISLTFQVERGTRSLEPENGKIPEWMIDSVEEYAKKWLDRASRATKHADDYRAAVLEKYFELKAYADFFGIEFEIPNDFHAVEQHMVEMQNARRAAEKKAHDERVKKQAQDLEDWKANIKEYGYFATMALRVKGDFIETSQGASIPLQSAIDIWPLLNRVKDKDYVPKEPIMLGHYQLRHIKDGNLQVGCHSIPISEVERIAKELHLV